MWKGTISNGTVISSGQTLTFPTPLNNYNNWNFVVLRLHHSEHNIAHQIFVHKSLVGITANYKVLLPLYASIDDVSSILFILTNLNESITPTITGEKWVLNGVYLL